MTEHPLIRLNPGQERRLKSGHPWAFSNEIAMKPEYRQMEPGAPVRLEGDDGWRFGTFAFNPHSLIAARLLDRDPAATIDAAWVRRRLDAAIALRARITDGPFHRLVHAEADGLPGLVIDRYGDVVVLQANTAGMDRLTPAIVATLTGSLPLRAVVARNDAPVRAHEGLPAEVTLLHGSDATAMVEEGGVRFPVDPLSGQKTGWFFDQRPNRDRVAALAEGARVLDVFCHVGAFGLRCAAAGAKEVVLVDASAPALERAQAAAALNGVAGRVSVRRGDAFEVMAEAAQAGERYDIVVCDPPAFAKSKKDQAAGLRAYGRMARVAAPLVSPGGFLFVASCSHHAPLEAFAAAIAEGLYRARRGGRILATCGAGADHPVHPQLPESAYLKGQLFQLD
ncbi:LSU m5C1962 methyltransferase RlmI [Rhodovastum atsumiense]|uniref:Class I SAM-dependent rRNA methyltransferase n=1 Tax=Rhodovastum atsumiense TaxID=504468 RepID=A0A5M6IT44_9PROT|nr:class I SAM-dependent rRNA methyltransferase [Rhodovastum atsumiense]KAA5610997.1 class I SAM-dependent rRNA methyltransferase [Rhodovastum atsumiense]CAH2600222.1 LSU m5C1962 methyltransferase RlmI [Rhodovastum atsumiense]